MEQTAPKEKTQLQQFFLPRAGLCISSPMEMQLNVKSHRETTPPAILLEETHMFSLFIRNKSDPHTVVVDKLRDRQVS